MRPIPEAQWDLIHGASEEATLSHILWRLDGHVASPPRPTDVITITRQQSTHLAAYLRRQGVRPARLPRPQSRS